MKRRDSAKNRRGSTLVEVLVAMFLLLLIFLFLTGDLIQSSQAENLASNHSGTVAAANYLLGVMRTDGQFWKDWATGPSAPAEPCGGSWTPYTDDITTNNWHPLCANIFPEGAGAGVHLGYMWNAQLQAGDPNVAQLSVWVLSDEGGRRDVYELRTTRMQTAPQAQNSGIVPTNPPSPSPSPTTPPPSGTPKPSPSPKPSGSPTATPSFTPKPSPSPTGIYE
ncbi:MAG: prepilin-type N-terminal cleavage/methylation domain-containing protein [Candidatus Eremiobacteraeota bacterium]|nr:prepilin-type N-terminal cleavage/methylation domain-containing protein [Candidatus Eremiobacteraeota bacterium]